MLDDENSRVKGLLVATTFLSLVGWLVGLISNRVVNSESYIIWTFEHNWVIYLTWFFLFIGFCWIPVSLFLLAQGFILRKKYDDHSFEGDRTIGNLSVVLPLAFLAIYVVTRVLY
jgi:hypothetical protein